LAQEIQNRLNNLRRLLKEKGRNALLITGTTNLYYFTGTAQDAVLLVTAEGEPWLGVRKNVKRAQSESVLTPTAISSMKELPGYFQDLKVDDHQGLGLELDILPAREYLRYGQLFPNAPIWDASDLLKTVRMIKSPYETDLIRKAQVKHDAMFRQIPAILRQGMTELSLAAAIEAFARNQGHQGYITFRGYNSKMFYGHVMAGANAAVPGALDSPTCGKGVNAAFPQGPSLDPILPHQPIIVDYVGFYGGYLVDQTRIYALGKLPSVLLTAHEVALEIQNLICQKAEPDLPAGELYKLAVKVAQKYDLEENFLGVDQPVSFVGHGVGLELNEYPVLSLGNRQPLKPGMVIAVEPKFSFPQQGVVGIENTFVLEETGLKRLSQVDDNLVVVE